IYQKALFTLGELLFRREDFAAAQRRLQEALERYPADPAATQARWQLAQACQKLALDACKRGVGELSTPEATSHYMTLHRKWLESAAGHFQKLADDLTARQRTGALDKDDSALLRRAAFAAAECRFELGQFDQAIQFYETLAEQYRLQVEGLMALRSLWRASWGSTGC